MDTVNSDGMLLTTRGLAANSPYMYEDRSRYSRSRNTGAASQLNVASGNILVQPNTNHQGNRQALQRNPVARSVASRQTRAQNSHPYASMGMQSQGNLGVTGVSSQMHGEGNLQRSSVGHAGYNPPEGFLDNWGDTNWHDYRRRHRNSASFAQIDTVNSDGMLLTTRGLAANSPYMYEDRSRYSRSRNTGAASQLNDASGNILVRPNTNNQGNRQAVQRNPVARSVASRRTRAHNMGMRSQGNLGVTGVSSQMHGEGNLQRSSELGHSALNQGASGYPSERGTPSSGTAQVCSDLIGQVRTPFHSTEPHFQQLTTQNRRRQAFPHQPQDQLQQEQLEQNAGQRRRHFLPDSGTSAARNGDGPSVNRPRVTRSTDN